MDYEKLYQILDSIVEAGNNPFSVSYWRYVFFHPYTSLVHGIWVDNDSNDSFGNDWKWNRRMGQYSSICSFEQFKSFMDEIEAEVTKLGWIVTNSRENYESHNWDNKVAVTLEGLNGETIVLGWKDWSLCIGTELQEPQYGVQHNWVINPISCYAISEGDNTFDV